jgi:2-phospho-L-lactate guanylyltransferase
LVPIKRRDFCKSRLTTLSPQQRALLVRLMLDNVLAAVLSSRCVGNVAVISPEPETDRHAVVALRDSGTGLNAALESGRRQLAARGARELVVLPADLPFLLAADVDRLVSAGRHAGFAIAPDAAGTGTNGLFLRAGARFGFRFGAGSCAAHATQACDAQQPAVIVRTDGFAHDIDLADDLARLMTHPDERFRLVTEAPRAGTWLPAMQPA